MNTVNKSTGFSPFQLHLGRTPRMIPPLIPASNDAHPDITTQAIAACTIIEKLERDVWEAQDNIFKAKISQVLGCKYPGTKLIPKWLSSIATLHLYTTWV
jgi:hypothetical protein